MMEVIPVNGLIFYRLENMKDSRFGLEKVFIPRLYRLMPKDRREMLDSEGEE